MAESKPETLSPTPQMEDPPGLPFPVVGVGASAGGLEAYTELLDSLSAKPNLALLLVRLLHHRQPRRNRRRPLTPTRIRLRRSPLRRCRRE